MDILNVVSLMALIRLVKSVITLGKANKDKIRLGYLPCVVVRKDPHGLRFQIRAITIWYLCISGWAVYV